MRKFKVYEEEYYPFYELEESETNETLKLSEKDYKFIKKSYENFYKAQELIKTKLEFEIDEVKKSNIEKQNKCKHDYITTCKTTLRQNDKVIKYSDYKCSKCGLEKTEKK